MNAGDGYRKHPKQISQQPWRTQYYRHFVAVVRKRCILFLFLLGADTIFSFRSTRSIVCARQKRLFTTAGFCDNRLNTIGVVASRINKNNDRSRLFGGTTGSAESNNSDKTMTTANSSSSNNNDEIQENPLSRLGLPEPLLLGSASFTRKLILKEMGVPFSKLVRPIDEKALGDRSENAPPRELVLLLANAKMDRLVQELKENKNPDDLPLPDKTESKEGWVVLTGDQVVTCAGKILEKPESIEEAKQFVEGYAKAPPSTVGSVVLYHHPSGIRVEGVDTATIYFNLDTLGGSGSSVLIDSLIEQGEPVMSCAGGLMIEHPLTKQHVDRIDGTEDSVMGLSKDLVLRLLQELSEKLHAQ